MPYFEQLFVTAKGAPLMGIALDRLAYCCVAERSMRPALPHHCRVGPSSTRAC